MGKTGRPDPELLARRLVLDPRTMRALGPKNQGACGKTDAGASGLVLTPSG